MSEVGVKDDVALEALVGQVADEFLRRQTAGERPDVEEYADRHPGAADLLRKVLASLQLFQPDEPEALATGDRPGGTLGDFRIIREVGRGGMGIVYEAEQISLGRRVALKVLPFAATMDPRHLQRFRNEVRAAASLQHERIVPVYAVGCERGVHFYAMQFIDGLTLAQLIARRSGAPADTVDLTHAPSEPAAAPPAPVAQTAVAAVTATAPRPPADYRAVAGWVAQAAEALEHAHSLGIVHRDVKPANLMVDAQGKLWVTDFGLARTGSDCGLTQTGDVLGTLRYMSPEQALARHGLVDHRTDVYSLGATLYELLTSRPTVDGRDREEMLRKITFEEPPAPRSVDRAIPADLETVVLKALAKEPNDRYATAQDLADDLRRFLADRSIQARRPSLRQRAVKFARRHSGVLMTALAGLVLMVAVLAVSSWLLWQKSDELTKANYEANQRASAEAAAKERAEQNWLQAMSTLQGHLKWADHLRDTGRFNEAAGAYVTARGVVETGVANLPQKSDYQLQLRAILHNLGWSLRQANRPSEAADVGLQTLAIGRQRLADIRLGRATYSNEQKVLWEHAQSYVETGECLVAAGRLEEAEPTLREARGVLQENRGQLMDGIMEELDEHFLLATETHLALVLAESGQPNKAEEVYQQALTRTKNQCQTGKWMLYDLELAKMLRHYGNLLYHEGRRDEAVAHYREARVILEALVKANPGYVQYEGELIWLLCTCPDPACRDSRRALEVAQSNPKGMSNPWFLRAVAFGQYRNGKLKEAYETLQKVNSMWGDSGGDAAVYWLLALTSAGQGNAKITLKCVALGDEVAKRRPNSCELAFLRAEVEAAVKTLQASKENGAPP
jgi:serine/threonine protein kinase